jgi:hypothetical protein
MRVWLQTSVAALRSLQKTGELAAPQDGYALTQELRDELGRASEEELEYAVSAAAAAASSALWAGTSGRRVVVVAEVGAAMRQPGNPAGSVVCTEPISLSQVDAVLVDPEDVTVSGDAGVEPDTDADLAWYATQEIPDLLAELA